MKLSPRSIILLTISAFGGTIIGRTLLQKRLYFLEQLLRAACDENINLQYDSHFYGPYSPLVGNETAVLDASGFLRCYTEPFGYSDSGFEAKRYSYELTDAGRRAVERMQKEHPEDCQKVIQILNKIKNLGDVNYVDLSIAAKTFFMLKQSDGPLTTRAAVEQAKRFSWQISERDVQRCFPILERLGLATTVEVSEQG